MARIIIFDITSSARDDNFNDVAMNRVNEWMSQNERHYKIKDISIFGFGCLKHTGIYHAKILITYEIRKKKG